MLRDDMILLLAFIIMPIVEISLLLQVGEWIGGWETLGLVVLTAVIGTALFRAQGFMVLARAQETLARGGFPADELFDGICILIAGVLLLTPGFVTDGFGLMLLVPGLRTIIARLFWQMASRSSRFEMHVHGAGFQHRHEPGGGGDGGDGGVIEGEYREVPPEKVHSAPDRLDKPGTPDATS